MPSCFVLFFFNLKYRGEQAKPKPSMDLENILIACVTLNKALCFVKLSEMCFCVIKG